MTAATATRPHRIAIVGSRAYPQPYQVADHLALIAELDPDAQVIHVAAGESVGDLEEMVAFWDGQDRATLHTIRSAEGRGTHVTVFDRAGRIVEVLE